VSIILHSPCVRKVISPCLSQVHSLAADRARPAGWSRRARRHPVRCLFWVWGLGVGSWGVPPLPMQHTRPFPDQHSNTTPQSGLILRRRSDREVLPKGTAGISPQRFRFPVKKGGALSETPTRHQASRDPDLVSGDPFHLRTDLRGHLCYLPIQRRAKRCPPPPCPSLAPGRFVVGFEEW